MAWTARAGARAGRDRLSGGSRRRAARARPAARRPALARGRGSARRQRRPRAGAAARPEHRHLGRLPPPRRQRRRALRPHHRPARRPARAQRRPRLVTCARRLRMQADALATALTVLGETEGLDLARRHGLARCSSCAKPAASGSPPPGVPGAGRAILSAMTLRLTATAGVVLCWLLRCLGRARASARARNAGPPGRWTSRRRAPPCSSRTPARPAGAETGGQTADSLRAGGLDVHRGAGPARPGGGCAATNACSSWPAPTAKAIRPTPPPPRQPDGRPRRHGAATFRPSRRAGRWGQRIRAVLRLRRALMNGCARRARSRCSTASTWTTATPPRCATGTSSPAGRPRRPARLGNAGLRTLAPARPRTLNPDSQGPCYLLTLAPPSGARAAWQAGDIAEIGPRRERGGELLPHREYSIAPLPTARCNVLVRQMRGPDGDLGLGRLTHVARLGDEIDLRLRSNRNFHAPDDDRPMILIGNGTWPACARCSGAPGGGPPPQLAGVRRAPGAHDWFCRAEIEGWRDAGGNRTTGRRVLARPGRTALRAAPVARTGRTVRAWIDAGAAARLRQPARHGGRRKAPGGGPPPQLAGVRRAPGAHDWFCRAEIEGWRDAGGIERLDAVFSRDQEERRYVQHLLREQAGTVRAWIDAGAAVYVCGSLQGMAGGVDDALRDILATPGCSRCSTTAATAATCTEAARAGLPATRHAAARRPYCNLIWALSITLFQRSRSAWICAPNSAGVLPSGKAPVSSIFAAVAGSRTACAKACASLSRTSSGRPAPPRRTRPSRRCSPVRRRSARPAAGCAPDR